ncbi:hypothetical protein SDC9_80216 [bioreactor metagenome]|uniref:Lipoprotein n=1 Tax=bioreactor metagenome TaxID=1076179 RepID=A0A644YZB3_9ZZZZ
MKKLILIIPLFIILFSSCSNKLIPTERKVFEGYFDYSKYAAEGFLISPNSYVGTFEPCGELQMVIFPAEKIVKGKTVYSSSDNSYSQEESLVTENIDYDELLKLIVDKAKLKGGNALVNIRFRNVYNNYYSEALKVYVKSFLCYEIEGFVIKRK